MFMMDAKATCVTCGWHTEGKNSMGNAAKHHQKTGHYVQCELYYGQFFGQPVDDLVRKRAKEDGLDK